MPRNAWRRLPRECLRRLTGTAQAEPWFVPAAVEYLAGLVQPGWEALEFGAGASTTWLAARVRTVTSLEEDAGWHERTVRRMRELEIENCTVRLMPIEEQVSYVEKLEDESLDLVVVDCAEWEAVSRPDCVAASRSKVRRGGCLVLDDSDRPPYRSVPAMLEGWRPVSFVGVRPRPLVASETTFFHRVR